jgi:hypothetical protein
MSLRLVLLVAPLRPLRQQSCPLGLTHPPGGLTDDHENDLWPRCAGQVLQRMSPPNRESVAEIARSTAIAVPPPAHLRDRLVAAR